MKRSCQHCGELIVGSAYRVASKEDGVTLLNLVVCSLCSMEAKRLRLHAEEITVSSKTPSARSTSNAPPSGIHK
jgi:hypothetical protein